jgi:hypothetical protein
LQPPLLPLLRSRSPQPRRTPDLDESFTKPQTAAIGLQL